VTRTAGGGTCWCRPWHGPREVYLASARDR
jgi:hypothetical protein